MESPRMRASSQSFVIPPPTFTGPHDLQSHPLDLGVHEESEDEPGVDEGALSDFLIAHIVNPPPEVAHPTHQKLRDAEATHQLRN